MGAHGSVAPEGAPGVAVAGVGEGVVFDLVVPRFHQLENGAVAAKRTRIRLIGWEGGWEGFTSSSRRFTRKCLRR